MITNHAEHYRPAPLMDGNFEYQSRIDINFRFREIDRHIAMAIDERMLSDLREIKIPSKDASPLNLIEFEEALKRRQETVDMLTKMIAKALKTLLDS